MIKAASLVIQDPESLRVLLLQRTDHDRSFPGMWCFPGGKQDEGETLLETVIRECFEETQIILEGATIHHMGSKNATSTNGLRSFEVQVFKTLMEAHPVTISDEHQDYKWVSPKEAFETLPMGQMTRSIVMDLMLCWPLRGCEPMFPDEPGEFGSVRTTDVHTGVDLYCELGTEVVAIEDGVVVLVDGFTGPNASDPPPWWNDTQCVMIEGASGVINYGELTVQVGVGESIKAGQKIGVVDTPVLKSFKGRPMVMLHVELMTTGMREYLWWYRDQEKPEGLLDPSNLLLKASHRAPPLQKFDLSTYDGKTFMNPAAEKKPAKWWAVWGGGPET